MTVQPGDYVLLDVPGNPRMHGQVGVVDRVEWWGAHLQAVAAATGKYRALHCEMVSVRGCDRVPAMAEADTMMGDAYVPTANTGHTGDVCDCCGGIRMRRSGTCLLCDDCGQTSGCG